MSFAAKVGLGVAVEYYLDIGVDRIWARVARISECLRRELDAVPGVTVRDAGETRCGIRPFDVEGTTPAEGSRGVGRARGERVDVAGDE